MHFRPHKTVACNYMHIWVHEWRNACRILFSCDATVVMKDDAEEDTYSTSDEMHEDSDATVMMKDDAGQNTCSPSGDETKVTRSDPGDDMGKCKNMVRPEEEIYI
jgi:hypothetical protein